MGVNRGLIKIRGNLISMVKIIVEAGVSVGRTESIKLKEEKEKVANKISGTKINKFISFHRPKNKIPNNNGTVEKIHPNRNELHKFPNRIVRMEIGHVITYLKLNHAKF